MLSLVVATELLPPGGPLVLAVDVSGGAVDYSERWAHEAVAALPEVSELQWFDHHLITQRVDGQRLVVPRACGGGTDVQQLLEHNCGRSLRGLVIVTDGGFDFYRLPRPKFPVVWVLRGRKAESAASVASRFRPPFGTIVVWE